MPKHEGQRIVSEIPDTRMGLPTVRLVLIRAVGDDDVKVAVCDKRGIIANAVVNGDQLLAVVEKVQRWHVEAI